MGSELALKWKKEGLLFNHNLLCFTGERQQVKYFCLISEDSMEDTKDTNDWGGESERDGEFKC